MKMYEGAESTPPPGQIGLSGCFNSKASFVLQLCQNQVIFQRNGFGQIDSNMVSSSKLKSDLCKYVNMEIIESTAPPH